MEDEKKSYQQVMKATSLFGGVQVLRILVTVIRSKVMATLLGPEGVGISNLLTRPLQLITTATQLGLDKSAVKEISSQYKQGDETQAYRMIAILKRLVWITAIIGAIFTIVFSGVLSKFTFDSYEYTYTFMWLGLAVVFNQLAMSNFAVLQGLRKLAFLAKANIYGSIAGLIVTIPLYYYLALDGILPAIVATSGFVFLFAYFFAKRTVKAHTSVTNATVFSEGKPMIKLGLALSFSSIIGLVVAYLILVFVRAEGGEIEAGFYGAGIAILNSYVGLIFNAMSTDYYPRLAAVCNDIKAVVKTVFEQAFIAVLLITPIVIVFIAFAPLLISLLYSSAFEPSVSLVRWGILGMVFKAVSWSMGYVIIAKGDAKLFTKTAVFFNSILLTLNVIGYYYWGLEGIGISLLVYFIIHYLGVRILTYYRYGFKMKAGFYPVFLLCLVLCVAAFGATYIEDALFKYGVLICLIVISSLYSFRLLDTKIGFRSLLDTILKRKK
ncbi:O-antigen translocase [uncultured Dokdonia sp.]|uniref:O-antigen translocase n=1 Tax=uncultured Dokdonia sp. TaxID=575653 RepID=UPI00261D8949|nr:O-antigen translocase [uncultured Dokdonia sp.]